MIRRIVKRSADYINGPSGNKRSGDRTADDLALRPSQRDRETARYRIRRRRLGKKSRTDGEDIKSAMESNSSTRGRGRLTERDVRDGTGTGEQGEAHISPATEPCNSLDNIVPTRDFENVGTHDGLGIARNDDGRFGFVLGARRATPRPPNDFNASSIARKIRIFGSLMRSWVGGGGGGCGRGCAAAAAARIVFLGGLAFASD